jgi:hypothetical protein
MFTTSVRPILVTGTHRSGTTWVGEMIARHPRVVYVWEPFNPGVPGSPVKYWFHHVTDEESEPFRAFLRPYLTFRYPWWAAVKERPRPRRLAGATLRAALGWWRRLFDYRPLMKDPIALFSSEWLARTYNMDVVVLIRHPAAFASSLKRLEWHFLFAHLLEQRRLMEEYLEPFRDEIRRFSGWLPDIIDQAILVWRIMHHVIARYQRTHPEWIFVRHEDLSRAPLPGYQNLFDRLGLHLSPRLREAIETHSSSENPREAPERIAHQLKRDSKGNIWNWRSRLQPEEILHIRKGTEDVASLFYSDADWDGEASEMGRSA